MDWLSLAFQAAMVVALLVAVGATWALDRSQWSPFARLRSRFLLGVPWGTLVLCALVLAVYLGLQNGLDGRYSPLHIPFTSWSYTYPLGMVTAPFAHQGYSHVVGNLLGTLALAPLAEYAWSHYPRRTGATSFGSWRTNPYVRAFVLFPLGAAAVGLGTSVLHWGPIVGFSGVVYAFAGFALVRFPVATVLAVVGQQLLSLAFRAFQTPISPAEGGVQFTQPSWAGVAVLGHYLGLLLGALAAALVVRRREGAAPSAARLVVGAALVGTLTDLWALWWYRGASSFVLYRGAGVAVVLFGAAVVATVVRASDRPLVGDVTRRQAATLLLVIPLLTVGLVAVPVNFVDVSEGSVPNPDGAVQVRGYSVTYAEGATNQRISVVDVSVFNETTTVEASGVIVVNPDREIWAQTMSTDELAATGYEVLTVGGADWEREVLAVRSGWRVAGNDSVYQVWIRPEGGTYVRSFTSPVSTARPVIDGRNVTVVHRSGPDRPDDVRAFALRVSRGNQSLGTAPIPTAENATSAGGLRFVRDGSAVFAVRNGTRVAVAARETGA
jgi:membrane associated rhomboid family serine protease